MVLMGNVEMERRKARKRRGGIYIRIALARRHADLATEGDHDKVGAIQHLVTKEKNRRHSVTAKPQLGQKRCYVVAAKPQRSTNFKLKRQ